MHAARTRSQGHLRTRCDVGPRLASDKGGIRTWVCLGHGLCSDKSSPGKGKGVANGQVLRWARCCKSTSRLPCAEDQSSSLLPGVTTLPRSSSMSGLNPWPVPHLAAPSRWPVPARSWSLTVASSSPWPVPARGQPQPLVGRNQRLLPPPWASPAPGQLFRQPQPWPTRSLGHASPSPAETQGQLVGSRRAVTLSTATSTPDESTSLVPSGVVLASITRA